MPISKLSPYPLHRAMLPSEWRRGRKALGLAVHRSSYHWLAEVSPSLSLTASGSISCCAIPRPTRRWLYYFRHETLILDLISDFHCTDGVQILSHALMIEIDLQTCIPSST
jgi:hypothetical protein